MADRTPAPHTAAVTPIAGHFHTTHGYATWRPTGTADYLLIYTIAGGGQFLSDDGQQWLTSVGELTLIRPGTPHDYSTPPGGAWELLWVHFVPRVEWLDLLDWPVAWPGLLRLTKADAVRTDFDRLHAATLSADPLRDRLVTNALESLLLACEQINPQRRRYRIDVRIRQVLARIAEGLDQPLTVDSLASASGLSPSRLAHLFTAAMGMSVMQYVESRRLERAAELLRMTALDVQQVARQVGFASPFYFSLRFKKRTGKSPTAYRADVPAV